MQSTTPFSKRTLRQFWEQDRRFADAKRALEDWYAQVSQADWTTPADVKTQYRDASILKGSRVSLSEWLGVAAQVTAQ